MPYAHPGNSALFRLALSLTVLLLAGRRVSDLDLDPLRNDIAPAVTPQEHDNRVYAPPLR